MSITSCCHFCCNKVSLTMPIPTFTLLPLCLHACCSSCGQCTYMRGQFSITSQALNSFIVMHYVPYSMIACNVEVTIWLTPRSIFLGVFCEIVSHSVFRPKMCFDFKGGCILDKLHIWSFSCTIVSGFLVAINALGNQSHQCHTWCGWCVKRSTCKTKISILCIHMIDCRVQWQLRTRNHEMTVYIS